MKRIINEVTYNTETSTLIASYDYNDRRDSNIQVKVFQTRGGRFFALQFTAEGEVLEADIETMTREESSVLFVESANNVEVFDRSIADQVTSIREPTDMEATVFLRFPASLKRRIDQAAKTQGQSVNTFLLRLIESRLNSTF